MRNLITAHPGEVRVFFRQTKGTFPMGNIQLDVEVLDSIYKIMNGEHNVTINHYNNNLKGQVYTYLTFFVSNIQKRVFLSTFYLNLC